MTRNRNYEHKGYPVPNVVDPGDWVHFCVPVPNDPIHIQNFLGAVFELTRWFNYRKDPLKKGKPTADIWREIWTNLVQEAGSCNPILDEESECIDYGNQASFIEYAPADPFTQAGYIPPGYIAPPFYLITENNILTFFTGAQVGDVVTGWISLPVTTPALGEGLARLRIHVQGTGTVEIHLLQIPAGGMVLITTDDNIFSAKTLETSKDLVSLPVETITDVIQEIKFDTPGAHHIDVTFLPRFELEVGLVGYGGGIRKVVLCGFDEVSDSDTKDIEIEDCMRLRIKPTNACIIQMECSPDEWVDWYDPRTCLSEEVVSQPEPGGELVLGGCTTYNVTLRGNDKWILPVPVEAGYTIEVTNAQGGWSIDGATWLCPSGLGYALGLCVGGGGAAGAGFPIPAQPAGRLIAKIGASYYDAYNATIVVPPGQADTDVFFQMNDTDLSNNGGSVSFVVEVCHAVEVTWTKQYNFVDGAFQWTAFNCTAGQCGNACNVGAASVYSGAAWDGTIFGCSNQMFNVISSPVFPSAGFVNTVRVRGSATAAIPTDGFGSGISVTVFQGAVQTAIAVQAVPNGAFDITFNVNLPDVTQIRVSINDQTPAAADTLITIVDIAGSGDDPFN